MENETFACGTGATAAALSFAFKEQLDEGRIKVSVKGGNLAIDFVRSNQSFSEIWLIGPATFVFKGVIDD